MSPNTTHNAWTTSDALRFLVAFSKTNLSTLREGDMLNLRDDLDRFRMAPASEALPFPVVRNKNTPFPDSLDLYESFRGWVGKVLDGVVAFAEREAPKGLVKVYVLETPAVSLSVVMMPDETPVMGVSSNLWVGLQVKAAVILCGEGVRIIRRCPQCKTVFARVRKQRYCGRTCANKASMNAWLSRPKNQSKHRDLSHGTYAKKIRRRVGTSVKVARRPRQK